jgi:hypothetical protein
MEFEFKRAVNSGFGGRSTMSVRKDIPFEIVSMICRFAIDKTPSFDLEAEGDHWRYCYRLEPWGVEVAQRLRRVCKTMNAAASPFLFHEVSLASNSKSIDRLRCIANHPVFSRHVQVLYLDCYQYKDECLENPTQYAEALQQAKLYSRYSKEKVAQGFQTLRTLLLDQQKCRNERLDVACLAEVLPKMPHLYSIVMTYARQAYPFRSSYGWTTRAQRARQSNERDYEHIVDPGCNRRANCLVTGQYLKVLTNPAKRSGVKWLQLPPMKAGSHLRAVTLDFGGIDETVEAVVQLFRNLEKLNLELSGDRFVFLNTHIPTDDFAHMYGLMLKDGIKEARKLNTLALYLREFRDDAQLELSKYTSMFPKLPESRLYLAKPNSNQYSPSYIQSPPYPQIIRPHKL